MDGVAQLRLAAHLLVARLAVPRLARARLAFVAAPDQRRFLVLFSKAEFVVLEAADFVAQTARLFEFEIGGGVAHALLQILDIGAQIVADEVVALVVPGVDRDAVARRSVCDDIRDLARMMAAKRTMIAMAWASSGPGV